MIDTRYVYGAGCTWHGPMHEVGNREGMPCCPHCGGMLFEQESKELWDEAVAKTEMLMPGYSKFIDYLRETHHKSYDEAIAFYEAKTGVKLSV